MFMPMRSRIGPFTTSNGLPQKTVPAVQPTRAGHLWIATYNGLVRPVEVCLRRVAAGMMDLSLDAGTVATGLSGLRIHHSGS
jgi:ligand-binding sensor domain-containing protein